MVHDPPPSYNSIRPSRRERTPLVTGRGQACRVKVLYVFGAIAFALFLGQNAGLVRCPLNDISASQKAELRRQWALERNKHQLEVAGWVQARKEHSAELRTWELERAMHRKEREDWARQRMEEERVWREKQALTRREEELRQKAARDAFKKERAQEEHEREQAREGFQQEQEGWARQRQEEESHRLEVIRRSQGVYWTEPHGDSRCHSYGTRTYTSYLRDIPGDLNWLEVCKNMPPVVIHGREINQPSKCERNNNDVVGVWYIDFDEPDCVPYWDTVYNKGCTPGQTGVRRLEARLDGLIPGNDWHMMCRTTPATIHGTHFAHPTTCDFRGRWGMVGMWDFPNASCR